MKNGITILKKNPKYSIEQYDTLFFSIGLAISLLLVVLSFEWKSVDKINKLDLGGETATFEEILDIPISKVEPPPPPEKSSQNIEIVEVPDVEEIEEEIDINLDIEMTEETKVANYDAEIDSLEIGNEVEEEKVDEIFMVVEDQPSPIGGYEAYYQFIYSEIKYPLMALRSRVEGRVFIQFVVEKDGSLTDFEVVRGIGAGCDEEALRVLKMAPAWNPGKQRGKAVRVRMILPVTFKIVNTDS